MFGTPIFCHRLSAPQIEAHYIPPLHSGKFREQVESYAAGCFQLVTRSLRRADNGRLPERAYGITTSPPLLLNNTLKGPDVVCMYYYLKVLHLISRVQPCS